MLGGLRKFGRYEQTTNNNNPMFGFLAQVAEFMEPR